jgi:hypothetical protein
MGRQHEFVRKIMMTIIKKLNAAKAMLALNTSPSKVSRTQS